MAIRRSLESQFSRGPQGSAAYASGCVGSITSRAPHCEIGKGAESTTISITNRLLVQHYEKGGAIGCPPSGHGSKLWLAY